MLKTNLDWLEDVVRARQPRRLPTVLSRDEVAAVLGGLEGTVQIIVLLLYGTGMRILECLRLRVQDVDSTSATSPSADPRVAETG